MERYGKEQIRMPLVVSGDERPPKMLESFEINDGKAATNEETVVKQVAKGQYVVSDTCCPALHE